MESKLLLLKKLKNNKSEYKCECGNICVKNTSDVKRLKTKSCGCLHKKKTIERNKLIKRSYKDLTLSSFNAIYATYRHDAQKCNRVFELNKEDFRALITKNCFYCNKEPSNVKQQTDSKAPFIYNGIDRKDNKIGYVLNNCVTCCKDCNFFKSTRNYADFLNKIYTIYYNTSK